MCFQPISFSETNKNVDGFGSAERDNPAKETIVDC